MKSKLFREDASNTDLRKFLNKGRVPCFYTDAKGTVKWISNEMDRNVIDDGLKEMLSGKLRLKKKFHLESGDFEVLHEVEEKKGIGRYIVFSPAQIRRDNTLTSYSLHEFYHRMISSVFTGKKRNEVYYDVLSGAFIESNSDYAALIIFRDDEEALCLEYDPYENIAIENSPSDDLVSAAPMFLKILEIEQKPIILNESSAGIAVQIKNKTGLRTFLLTPAIYLDKIIGIIFLGRFGSNYSEKEVSTLNDLSRVIALSISAIQLREMTQAMEMKAARNQKLETIGKLASTMAHDINNLLSGIFGSISILREKDNDEDTERLHDIIENCAKKARELTRGLLSFGKSGGKQKEVINPVKIIDELADYLKQTFPPEIELIIRTDRKLFEILCNSTQLYQILMNLLVNAREAVGEHGIITLTARNLTVDSGNISLFPQLEYGRYVHFIIQDNGTGISRENLDKIFEPYFTTKGKQGGTGLGLYITYSIVKAYNGFIEVDSTEGKGTRFDIYIPAFQKQNSSEISYSPIVLLVDDEPVLRELLAELLEANEFNVVSIESGEEALRLLTEEIQADIVIIDFKMQGMDGLQCIEQIRKLGLKLPVILTTGEQDLENDERYRQLSVDAILKKPYEFEKLEQLIRRLI